jgi:hypothetical protein
MGFGAFHPRQTRHGLRARQSVAATVGLKEAADSLRKRVHATQQLRRIKSLNRESEIRCNDVTV